MNIAKWIGWMTAGMVVVLTAGCHNQTDTTTTSAPLIHGELYVPDSERRDVQNVTLAQAAAGARKDATLYQCHFDSNGINSLGRQKLDLMLEDNAPVDPLVVYLDLPANGLVGQDRDSVIAYLEDRGLQESQVALKDGTNPNNAISAAEATASLHAMQASPQGAAATGGGSTPAASTSTAGGGYQSH
jgi:hypothetical protein